MSSSKSSRDGNGIAAADVAVDTAPHAAANTVENTAANATANGAANGAAVTAVWSSSHRHVIVKGRVSSSSCIPGSVVSEAVQ